MFSEGSRFISGTPTSITRLADGKLLVAWNSATGSQSGDRFQFDLVISAVGRKPDTGKLGLKEAGVETDGDGKIICDSDGVSTSSPRM
jgi:pyruvate/2-oxoglutarate dehydrogenase complex dihydrolipoamide dehydrogenase (E3) component